VAARRAHTSLISLPRTTHNQKHPDGRPLAGVPPVVTDLHLSLPPGSRCLLLGANGAGKTSLLKVLGGHHLVPPGAVSVLGRPPFHDTTLSSSGALAYLGGNWEREVAFAGSAVPLAGDVAAGDLVSRIPGAPAERVARIMATLDIDPAWRLHRVSDGQRRRVQLAAGLARPYSVLLLDEITVDLDVLGRADLMNFLIEESEGPRKATVVYATHIFDGLDAWPTHVAFLGRGGVLARCVASADLPELKAGRLLELVTDWLREEAAAWEAAQQAQAGGSEGGKASAAAALPTWSNGWAAGRMTSTLKNSSNAVMRM
jgi:CCR4-NOT complex subunit CAF16